MYYTIKSLKKQFPDEDGCLEYVFSKRYKKECKCGGQYYRQKSKKCYVCSKCKKNISPLKDTIFQKSSTPLTDWFYVIYLVSQAKNGISSKEIQRQIGVTYKTAWRMNKQIRSLMGGNDNLSSGTVEADETYIGEVKKGKRGRGADGKKAVFGFVEREGKVKARVLDNVKIKTIQPIINKTVVRGSNLMTDDYTIYNRVEDNGFTHKVINHSLKEYVRGKVHTNTIEGFWSQLKRSIDGTYYAVSLKHLQTYVNQFSFLYNYRNSEKHIFDVLLEGLLCSASQKISSLSLSSLYHNEIVRTK